MATENEAPEAPVGPIGGPAPVVIRDEAPQADDDHDDETVEAGAEAKPERAKPGSPGSRRERRTLIKENERLSEEVRRSTKAVEEMRSEFRREIDSIRQRAVQPQQREAQTDPVDAEIASVKKTMAAHVKAAMTDPKYDMTEWLDLQERLHSLAARKAARDEMKEMERRQARMPRQDPTAAALRANRYQMLVSRNPWMTDPERGDMLTGMVGDAYRMLLRSGRPDSDELHLEAAAMVARQMGLGSSVQPRPDGRQARARHGFGGGERGNGHSPREVQVDPRMLEGLGLPEHLIRRATFGSRDD